MNDVEIQGEEHGMMEEKEYSVKDVSVSQRQIYILSLLSENPRGYQAEEIRQRLKNWDIEVSRRTISRDIDELSENYGICEEERGGKVYFFADKYTLRNVDLTIEDLASLAFAKEMLRGYAHLEMGKHACAFIDKMVENSASLNQRQFEQLCGHFKQAGRKQGGKDVIDGTLQKMVQNAIDNQNKIEITYYSFTSDESTKRVIHPYQLILMDDYLNVEAYCELRNEVRRFRLSRIETINVLDKHFEKQNVVREESFLKLAGSVTEDLELLFAGESVRYVKEYEASRAKRMEETKDGLMFYQHTAIAPDVVRWVRAFGPEVKVIKPVWLAEQLKAEAKKLLEE